MIPGRKLKAIAVLILLLIVAATSTARELSLEQAFTLAKDHSLTLKKEKATRDSYQSRFKAAVAERLPTLDLTALASYRDVVPQLEIAVPGGPSFTRDFGTHETYQTDLRLTLPLFTGGAIGGNIGLARSARDLQEAMVNATEDQLLLTVRLSYLSVEQADRMIDAARAALKRVEITKNDVQSLYQAGMADSVDILQTRRASNDARLQLRGAEVNRRRREIELQTLLGLSLDDSLQLISRPTEPGNNDITLTTVSPTKPELTAARASIAMNQSLVTINRSGYMPSLAVFGGWSYGKPNIDPFHDEFNDYFTFGATLNWSFNLGFKTKRNTTSAKHMLAASQHEYERVNERLNENARLAWETVKLSREQYDIARENKTVADDNYRLAQIQYREGTLSANRLLDIETALAQTETSLAVAKTDYNSAVSRYLFLVGSDKLKEGF